MILDHEAGERWPHTPAARRGETPRDYQQRLVRWAHEQDARLIPHDAPGGAAVTVRVDGMPPVYLTVRA